MTLTNRSNLATPRHLQPSRFWGHYLNWIVETKARPWEEIPKTLTLEDAPRRAPDRKTGGSCFTHSEDLKFDKGQESEMGVR
jgi:hypothetical protein